MNRDRYIRTALRIALLYALLAGIWIFLSDRLLAGLPLDPQQFTRLQTFKGWAFVVASPLLIFLLLYQELRRREMTAEALRESERRLSTLMGNLPGIAYRCRNDQDWNMEFVSEGCFDLTGYYPPDLIQNRTVSFGQLIHPDDGQRVWEQVQAALRDRRPFQPVYRISGSLSSERYVGRRPSPWTAGSSSKSFSALTWSSARPMTRLWRAGRRPWSCGTTRRRDTPAGSPS